METKRDKGIKRGLSEPLEKKKTQEPTKSLSRSLAEMSGGRSEFFRDTRQGHSRFLGVIGKDINHFGCLRDSARIGGHLRPGSFRTAGCLRETLSRRLCSLGNARACAHWNLVYIYIYIY